MNVPDYEAQPKVKGDVSHWLAAAALLGAYIVLCLPLILSGARGTSEAADQEQYHLPLIRTWGEHWPRVDLREYNSATTPLYHFVMAGVYRHLTTRIGGLQAINMVIGCGLLLVVYLGAARWLTPWVAMACVLPLACSSFTVGSGAWLTTDNLGLMFVCVTLSSALWRPATAGEQWARGISAALAVLTRQIHVWLVVPVALSGWPMRRLTGDADARPSREDLKARIGACLLPLIVVGYFIILWRGLTPPAFQKQHGGGANPATVVLALALCGAFGLFCLPAAWEQIGTLRISDVRLWMAILLPLAVSVAFPTGYDVAAGRWGGAIWEVARRFPAAAGRSLFFAPLAVMGGIMLLLLYEQARGAGHAQEALLLLIAMLAWLAAQTANHQAWQRYCEPILLVALAWLASLGARQGRRWWIGPLALAGLLLAEDLVTVYHIIASPLPQ